MESAQSVNEPLAQSTEDVPAEQQQELRADRTADNDPPPPIAEPTPADAGAHMHVDVYEVKGSTGTLLEHLQAGTIAWPPPMEWQAWVSWRSREGMRPTQRPDGYWTTSGYENHLYHHIMAFKYGKDWRNQMRSRAPGIVRKNRWTSP